MDANTIMLNTDYSGVTSPGASAALSLGAYASLIGQASGGTSFLRINGAVTPLSGLQALDVNNNMGAIGYSGTGNSNYCTMTLAEFLHISRALTSAEIAELEARIISEQAIA